MESAMPQALTPRAVTCGIFLGVAVCFANMYFGLQAGMVNSMPMQSALVGFTLFQSMQSRLATPLTPLETTVLESIAGSLGLGPFTIGVTSFIPALEFLTTSEDNGPMRLGIGRLPLQEAYAVQDNAKPAIQIFLHALSFVAHYLPTLYSVPIFGHYASSNWLWAFDLSPAYVGYGIVLGPAVNIHVLLGGVLGWGILSPMAKRRGQQLKAVCLIFGAMEKA
ncbi:hypothetical protein B0I35DRAFT_407341 [Stachybotrys elegans]|uniref:Uncharacterized protein n=1 Tax=Stachybotrys elegans TaxID=80388 RepID=A0A8K0WUU9_9HYPO|nr:hypothetical protein B0I35DRAFT_407341 [Stachybotrys elegans]